MPINRSLWSSLKKQYGSDKGRSVYYGMETKAREGKAPGFTKGLRTASTEGHLLSLGKPKPTTNSNVLKNRKFLKGLRLSKKD